MAIQAVDIDLAQPGLEDAEEMVVTPGEKESDESVESEYPHFHVERDEPLDIPQSGRMTVEYRIAFHQEGGDSDKEHNYKIELRRIVGLEPEKRVVARPAEETEGALDRLAEEKMKERENVSGS